MLMGLMFGKADRVIAWLGESGDETRLAFELIKTLHAKSEI
jgi:hypothetical protein